MQQIAGLGTEIVECLRIAQMIDRHGELFINRVYTPHEIHFCNSRNLATQHFAARWAAKEAVFKAIGPGHRKGLRWRDVEIRNTTDGRTAVHFTGRAREVVRQLGIAEVMLSVSHCRSHAMASAVALQLVSPTTAPTAAT